MSGLGIPAARRLLPGLVIVVQRGFSLVQAALKKVAAVVECHGTWTGGSKTICSVVLAQACGFPKMATQPARHFGDVFVFRRIGRSI